LVIRRDSKSICIIKILMYNELVLHYRNRNSSRVSERRTKEFKALLPKVYTVTDLINYSFILDKRIRNIDTERGVRRIAVYKSKE
jgi:hypothetical protein